MNMGSPTPARDGDGDAVDSLTPATDTEQLRLPLDTESPTPSRGGDGDVVNSLTPATDGQLMLFYHTAI